MPKVDSPTNGAAIRVIRERSGVPVRELVNRIREEHNIEVHEDHIRNVETGARNAGPRLTYAIAQVLRVPVIAILAAPSTSDAGVTQS